MREKNYGEQKKIQNDAKIPGDGSSNNRTVFCECEPGDGTGGLQKDER